VVATSASDGFAVVVELTETAAAMVAARHRREHPDATDDEVDEVVRAWWRDRPGAPDGDCPGRLRPVPAEWRD
jgi:hypothetical protein